MTEATNRPIDKDVSVFDDPNTAEVLKNIGITPGSKGEQLFKNLVVISVNTVVLLTAKALYPEHHWQTVYSSKEMFGSIKKIITNRLGEVNIIIAKAFKSIGYLVDEIVAEAGMDKAELDKLKEDDENRA